MKKENKVLILAFLIFLFLYLVSNKDLISLIGEPTIDTSATEGSLAINITVTNITVPEAEQPAIPAVTGAVRSGGIKPAEVKVIEPPLKPIHKKGNLFDINIIIPEKYREIKKEDNLVAEIEITNLNNLDPVSVNLEYFVEDKDKNLIFNIFETRVVEGNIKYLKEIDSPFNLSPGYYLLNVRLKYDGDITFAGYPFKIVEEKKVIIKEEGISKYIYIGFVLLLLGLIIAISYNLMKESRKAVIKRKESLFEQIKKIKEVK